MNSITDLPAQRAALCEAQRVRVARDAAADEAWLPRHAPDMLPVAKASWFREGEAALSMAAIGMARRVPRGGLARTVGDGEIASTSVVGAVAGQGFSAVTSSRP